MCYRNVDLFSVPWGTLFFFFLRGIFKFFRPMVFQEAVSMTKPISDPEEAAKRLLQEAHQRGSADNITIVMVRFLANREESSNTSSG